MDLAGFSRRRTILTAVIALAGLGACSDPPDPSAVNHIEQAATAAWAAGKFYALGTLVTYGGITYECRQAHTSQVGWEPPNAPALWDRPTPTGINPWTTQTHYIVHSAVTYNGGTWECLQEHYSQPDWTPPVAPSLWRCASLSCGGGKCTNLADGSLCDDGNGCTVSDTCKSQKCVGTAKVCPAGNACQTATCTPSTGACGLAPKPAGTSCSDGNVCNGLEVCDANATCLAGTALNCNDSNACTTDTCSPTAGCQHGPPPSGSTCVTLNPGASSVAADTSLAVQWMGISSPAADDLIGLFASGAADTDSLVTVKTGGTASGTANLFVFGDTVPGDYELRLLSHGTTKVATSAPFKVTARVCNPAVNPNCNVTVSVTQTTAAPGDTINVSWSGYTNVTSTSWMGVFFAGKPTNVNYRPIDPISNGTITITLPGLLPCGKYSVRLYGSSDTGTLVTYSSSDFDVRSFKCLPPGPLCNDGNDCTSGERLSDGVCRGGTTAAAGTPCDNHDPCTETAFCGDKNGKCIAATKKVCPAGSVCDTNGNCVDPGPPPPPPPPPCAIAFVHGSGPNNSGKSGDQVEASYWSHDGLANSLVKGVTGDSGCTPIVIGYDGTKSFQDAATEVGDLLNGAIHANNISPNTMIVVTHSMGGMVMRYILNNGEPNSPHLTSTFQHIRDTVRYAITIQGPHRGSEAADAEYSQSDSVLANVAGLLAPYFGFDKSAAHASLRRSAVESFAWADAGRTRPLVLIGGLDTGDASRTANETNSSVKSNDDNLDRMRQLLCHERGPLNGYGSQCYGSAITISAALLFPGGLWIGGAINAAIGVAGVPGDGLVETHSAMGENFDFGHYLRFTQQVEADCGKTADELVNNPDPFPPKGCDPQSIIDFLAAGIQQSTSVIGGALLPWLATQANHEHGRYNDLSTGITYKSGRSTTARFPEEIRRYGLNLPCSDPEQPHPASCSPIP